MLDYVVFCAVLVSAASMSIKHNELGSPVKVAQCRSQCLAKFVKYGKSDDTCLQDPDCFMCWENCAVLQDNYPLWSLMCDQPRLCFPGCQQACSFHRENLADSAQKLPVIPTMGEPSITVTGNVITWSKKDKKNLVYVILQKVSVESWRQLAQITEERFVLPTKSSRNLRILVVGPEGFLGFYRPNEQANQQTVMTTSIPNHWSLHEVSLIHQRVLVIAEIAWPAQRIGKRLRKLSDEEEDSDYLVTWEVDGGGLKGHLYTDATSVTLSLWPDTVYQIQVELVNSPSGDSERSESLTIDTRKAPLVTSDERVAPAAPLINKLEPIEASGRMEATLAIGVAAGFCILVFGIVIILVARRRRLSGGSVMGSSSDLRSDFDSSGSKDCPEIIGVRSVIPVVIPSLTTSSSFPKVLSSSHYS